jgi:hypothetical protein
MTFTGFQIERLIASGTGKEDVSISFSSGLNAVFGPSDTGKSFILECIDFMLGSGTSPKEVPESEGYSLFNMQLRSHDNTRYTLQRHQAGGDFKLYEVAYDDIRDGTDFAELSDTHSEHSDENVSSFLLKLSNLSDKKLLFSKEKKKTRNLSFRHLAKFIAVSEQRILEENSIINASGQYTDRTLYSTLFKLLLTGSDYTGYVSKEEVGYKKSNLAGSIESLKEIIKSTKEKIKELKEETLSEKKIDKLDQEIEKLLSEAGVVQEKISNNEEERKTLWFEINDNKQKFSVNDDLLKRFELLKEHYESDLERLAAINETGHFFEKIGIDHCPVCGSSPENHDCDHVLQSVDVAALNKACASEIEKIEKLLKDLDSTVQKLSKEQEKINSRIEKKKEKYKKAQQEISELLNAEHRDIKSKLNTLTEQKNSLNRISIYEEELQSYIEKKQNREKELEKYSQSNEEPRNLTTPLEAKDVTSFLKTYEKVLKGWNFPNFDGVSFSETNLDFVVSSKNRSAFGKGYRALLYSAFSIALMEHCIENDMPHPGFVVLDSPLTTFKEAEPKEEDAISQDLKHTFFDNLADNLKGQLIVLDNEEPPDSTKLKIKYHEFTGVEGVGRKGFF